MFVNDAFSSPEAYEENGGHVDGQGHLYDTTDREEAPRRTAGRNNRQDEPPQQEGEYYDLRDSYCRELWTRADELRRFEHDQRARVGMVTAMVRMAVHEEPIRNADQAREVFRVGETLVEKLRGVTEGPVGPGKFATAAVAMLAVLVDAGELVSMGDLISRAGRKLERGRSFRSLETILSQPGSCVAWAQMTPLLEKGLGFVKKRQRKSMVGGCGFELTDIGQRKAPGIVRNRRGKESTDKGALRSWKANEGQFFVAVDDREGGGDAHHLGSLCRRLRKEEVPHETRTLEAGDYLFIRRSDGEACGPVIERKTAVDLADSVKDDRWRTQCRKMQALVNDPSSNVTKIVYVIVGKLEDHVFTACGCGCFGVGACKNPTVSELRSALVARGRMPNVTVVELPDERAMAHWLATELKDVQRDHAASSTPTKRRGFALDDDEEDEALPVNQQPQQKKKKPKKTPEATQLRAAAVAWTRKDSAALEKFTLPVLKTLCQKTGATMSGAKKDVVARLLEPPEPWLLAQRKLNDGYVPRDRTCGHAILCGMERSERRGGGPLNKDQVMSLGERTKVSEKSLYEKVGPMGYDGWTCAKDLVTKGEPPLCKKAKNLYTLTKYAGVQGTVTVDAGKDVAIALHAKAHVRGWCSCGDPPPEGPATRIPTLADICGDDDPTPTESSPRDIRSFAVSSRPQAATPPTATAIRKRNRPPPPLTGDDDYDSLWDRPPPPPPRNQQPPSTPVRPRAQSHPSSDDNSVVDLTESPAAPAKQPQVVVIDSDDDDDDDDDDVVDLTGDD